MMAGIHAASREYRLAEFKAGENVLKPIELREVGDVRGKSMLHLQCHFGLDTMSWARLGANVTGLDFSDQAIALARSISTELKIPARFLHSNIYDAPGALDEKFELALPGAGSGSRNAAELPEQEAGDGFIVRVVERSPQVPLERYQRIRPFHEERRAVAFGAAHGLVVLVEDVAHDLLDEEIGRASCRERV